MINQQNNIEIPTFCPNCGQKMTNPNYCLHCGTQPALINLKQEETEEIKLAREEYHLEEELNKRKDKLVTFTIITGILSLFSYLIFLLIELVSTIVVSFVPSTLKTIVYILITITLPTIYFIKYFNTALKVLKCSNEYTKLTKKEGKFTYKFFPIIAMIFSIIAIIIWILFVLYAIKI